MAIGYLTPYHAVLTVGISRWERHKTAAVTLVSCCQPGSEFSMPDGVICVTRAFSPAARVRVHCRIVFHIPG